MYNLIIFLKYILVFCIIKLSFFSIVFSQVPFLVESKNLKIIPLEYLSFLEGYDETTSFDKLEDSKWTDKLMNPQSMVNGYWVRFIILNNLEDNKLGVNHNVN